MFYSISCQKYRKELLKIVSHCCCCIVSTSSTSHTNSHRIVLNQKHKTNERGHEEEEQQQQLKRLSNLNSSNININELTIIPSTPHNPHQHEESSLVFQYPINDVIQMSDKKIKTNTKTRRINFFNCFPLLFSNQNTKTKTNHGEIVRV
jgi:hypothetical protein